MAYDLTFSELVQKQITEALDYYDAISTSLGQKLEDDLINAYHSLKEHPYHYFNLNKQFRRMNLLHFPYQLIFAITEKDREVLIAALFHQHINPKRIKKVEIVSANYPKSISVLSPIFKLRLKPFTDASLPINELSITTSYNVV